MKNKLMKKLVISCLTLVFALVATASTTYAWFTVNSSVTTDDVQMTVTSNAGIYVALVSNTYEKNEAGDDEAATVTETVDTWKKDLNLSPVFGSLAKMNPVTSIDGKDFYALSGTTKKEETDNKDNKFTYDKLKGPVVNSGSSTEAKFVNFKLVLAVSTSAASVSVTSLEAKSFASSNPDVALSTEARVENVLRASIKVNGGTSADIFKFNNLYHGNTSAGNDATAIESNDIALSNYNNAYSTEVPFAEKTLYFSESGFEFETGAKLFNDLQYQIGEGDDKVTLLDASQCKYVKTNAEDLVGTLPILDSYKYMILDINMWFEGNAYECLNAIFNQTVKVAFTLTANSQE